MSKVEPPKPPASKRKLEELVNSQIELQEGGSAGDEDPTFLGDQFFNEEEQIKGQTAIEKMYALQSEMSVITDQHCRKVAHIEVENHAARKGLFDRRAEACKDLPNFWQQAISNHESLMQLVTMVDFGILEYMTELNMSVAAIDEKLKDGREMTVQSHKLMFHFKENPFFEDKVLWREMFHRIGVDDHITPDFEDFDDDGSESALKKLKEIPPLEFKIRESKASGIKWKDGNDLFTPRAMKLEGKPLPGGLDEHESFFWFFKEKSRSDEDIDEDLLEYEDIENIANVLKEDIFEEPLKYYLGPESDYEDEDDDDEGEDDDDDEEEDAANGGSTSETAVEVD